jgi:hypothetical protein
MTPGIAEIIRSTACPSNAPALPNSPEQRTFPAANVILLYITISEGFCIWLLLLSARQKQPEQRRVKPCVPENNETCVNAIFSLTCVFLTRS